MRCTVPDSSDKREAREGGRMLLEAAIQPISDFSSWVEVLPHNSSGLKRNEREPLVVTVIEPHLGPEAIRARRHACERIVGIHSGSRFGNEPLDKCGTHLINHTCIACK